MARKKKNNKPILTPELIHGLVSSVLLRNFDEPSPTPPCHLEWWQMFCSEHPKVALAAPRSHAKTSALTLSYTLASILFKASSYVLLVSDTSEQANLFLGNIKSELLNNKAIKELFGFNKLIKDAESDIIGTFTDGTKFRIIAKGSHGGSSRIRGFNWMHKRPDLIVVDDAENDESVLNEERRKKFREWLFSALLPAGSMNCRVRIVGTILHLDSALERLMPPIDGETTVKKGLKWVWGDGAETSWLSARYEAHNDDFSQFLWPERFTKERLQSIRLDYKRQGMVDKYNQEYRNYPIDPETQYFRPQDFVPILDHSERLDHYVGCDLAISEKKGAAYTAIAVVGINWQGILKVVDIRRFRGDTLEIMEQLFEIQKFYNPHFFFLEEENIARSIGPVLNREMQDRDVFLNIHTIRPIADKIQRARGIQGRMRSGKIQWDKDSPWYQDAYSELTTFPRGRYKDQTDALSMIGLGLNEINDAYSDSQVAELDREYFEDSLNVDYGRSQITGY